MNDHESRSHMLRGLREIVDECVEKLMDSELPYEKWMAKMNDKSCLGRLDEIIQDIDHAVDLCDVIAARDEIARLRDRVEELEKENAAYESITCVDQQHLRPGGAITGVIDTEKLGDLFRERDRLRKRVAKLEEFLTTLANIKTDVASLAPGEDLLTVNEVPFEMTLDRKYRIGFRNGAHLLSVYLRHEINEAMRGGEEKP